jgi:replicative DNA helicase
LATASNVEYYSHIIRDRSVLRRLISTAANISDVCYSPTSEAERGAGPGEASIFGIREGRDTQTLQPINGMLKGFIGHVETLMTRGGGVTGVPTGFRDLYDLTGGFQPSDLIILAGRPSMGKTAFALNLAIQTAIPEERDVKSGQPYSVAFFPWKCPRKVIRPALRVGSWTSDVRTGRVKPQDSRNTTALQVSPMPQHIDDTRPSAAEMGPTRAQERAGQPGLNWADRVDYLQLMRGTGNTRIPVIRKFPKSPALKALSRSSRSGAALSHSSRWRSGRQRPMLAYLRRSGPRADADVIAFVSAEVYNRDNPN